VLPRFASRPRDLDIEFADSDRVRLACFVVAASHGISGEDVLTWTLDRRRRALAAVAAGTFGDTVAWQTRCTASACRQPMELELPLAPFLSDVAQEPAFECSRQTGDRLIVRLPTGHDQRAWRSLAVRPDELPLAMATSLVAAVNGRPPEAGWQLPADWLDDVETQLAARDSGTVTTVTPKCPTCGAHCTMDLDVESILLELFAREQRQAMDDVHRLARAYHWSEADVLGIPPRRRAAYLQHCMAEA
jgi:hypothetical protein